MTERDETEEFVEDNGFPSELHDAINREIFNTLTYIPPEMHSAYLNKDELKILTRRQLYEYILNFRVIAIKAYNARDLKRGEHMIIINAVYILIIVFLVLTGTYH